MFIWAHGHAAADVMAQLIHSRQGTELSMMLDRRRDGLTKQAESRS
jgi:hypothetical protein